MADAVTTQKIIDGDRHVSMKFTNISAGTSGGETRTVKIDVSALNPSSDGDACTGVSIRRIHGVTEGMSVDIQWADATTTDFTLITTTPTDDSFDFDYTRFGGISNNASTPTGDVAFTTNSPTDQDRYTIWIEAVKKYG